MKLSFNQAILGAFLVAILLMVFLGLQSLQGMGRLVINTHWVEHTQTVIDHLQTLLTEVEEESRALRGYLITGDQGYQTSFHNARQTITTELREIHQLTSDNPDRQADLAKLNDLLVQHLALMESVTKPGQHLEQAALVQEVEEGNRLVEQIKVQVTAMQTDERRLLQVRSAAAVESAYWGRRIIGAGSACGVILMIVAVLLLNNEMTARKVAEETLRQSEQRSRSIIASAHDAFISIDVEGHIRDWNLQAESIFGWPRGEVLGHFLHETIIPQQYREAHLRGIKHLRATGEGPVLNKTIEITALRRNGEEFPVEIAIWPVRMGSETTFNAFVRDITTRKEAEKRIQKLNDDLKLRADQLEVSNQELESFTYSVSHDLRAPLRHIHGFVEILQKSPALVSDETSLRHMTVIATAARQMGLLIDDLLNFSRTGRAKMFPTKIDLRKIVDEVVTDLVMEIKDRRIAWKIHDMPTVMGDPALLRLVWANLISNAVKFTRNCPKAEIEIGSMPAVDRASKLPEQIFYVRDNGVGFDMQYASKLFGVFQRLHHFEDFEGTGIGLANVQRIIHRHGGRVWAEGKVDGGATFYFSLPIP